MSSSGSPARWVILSRWVPAILWMAVISTLSTDAFSAAETSRFLLPLFRWLFPGALPQTLDLLHTAVRKGMHVIEYGLLALLWYRAFRWDANGWHTKSALAAFLLAAGFAVADETHQMFEPKRTASLLDVGWDSLGAAVSLLGRRLLQR